jgi:hypothetical protein
MFDPTDLLRLARLYAAAEGVSLHTVGRRACAGNNRVFRRIEEGHGANTRTLSQIETWFRANWPQNAPWPADLTPGPLAPRRRRKIPNDDSSPAPTGDVSCAVAGNS